MTMNLPERDRYSESLKEMKAKIAMIFGGRAAEELIFGADNVTSGAANDIMQATRKARSMVTEWGMSNRLGPLRYSENEEEVFLGHSVTQRKNVSDATAKIIDEEIRHIIEEGENTARDVLSQHLDDLHTLAKGLLEYETLSGDEIDSLLKGEAIHRPDPDAQPHHDRRSSVPSAGKRSKKKIKPKSGVGDVGAPQPES